MPYTATIQLTVAGTNTGPFNLYSDVDNYFSPFETNISKLALMAGYTSVLVPNGATTIRVLSVSGCNNYVDIVVSNVPTPTPTPTPVPTDTPTPTPTGAPTNTPTSTPVPTDTPTPTPTGVPTDTPTPSPTDTPTPTPTNTNTPTPVPIEAGQFDKSSKTIQLTVTSSACTYTWSLSGSYSNITDSYGWEAIYTIPAGNTTIGYQTVTSSYTGLPLQTGDVIDCIKVEALTGSFCGYPPTVTIYLNTTVAKC